MYIKTKIKYLNLASHRPSCFNVTRLYLFSRILQFKVEYKPASLVIVTPYKYYNRFCKYTNYLTIPGTEPLPATLNVIVLTTTLLFLFKFKVITKIANVNKDIKKIKKKSG